MEPEEQGEEAQKMAALKRAYADIILNTAKEAATRILVSERKSIRCQQELFAAKEDALNTLLRVKQVMDSRIVALERECSGQKAKIEELEGQLSEAEEIVKDLRADLNRTNDEIETMKSTLAKQMDNRTANNHGDLHDSVCQEKNIYSSDSIMCPMASRFKLVSISDNKGSSQNQPNRCEYHGSSIGGDAQTHYGPLDAALPAKEYFASNPDFASIILRRKEPAQLYISGCTQRILACEQDRLMGKELLGSQTVDSSSRRKGESIEGERKAENAFIKDSPKADNAAIVEKSADTKEMVRHDNSSDKGQVVKFFRRSNTRKKRAKFNQVEALNTWAALPAQATEGQETSNVYSCSESSPHSLGNLAESEANPSNTLRVEPCNGFDSHCNGRTDATEVVQEDVDKLKLLTEESLSNRQESKIADSSDIPICKVNLETADVPVVSPHSKDEKPSNMVGSPAEAMGERLLKYTFRRKRKREPVSVPKDEIPIEKKNTSRRRMGEKQSVLPETKKPTQTVGSSRDTRRLVQVARQLISLSGKRW